MPTILDEPGFDTWLARLLHERQRVELGVLQGLLAGARRGGSTLAETLCTQGLLTRQEVEGYLLELSPEGGPGGAWKIGTEVDGYRIAEELGAGGMGVVYRVRHGATGAEFALKTLLAGADTELHLRFQREAEAQARVDAHRNVVRVHALGNARGRLYLIMDLARGGSLEGRLRAGPLEAVEAASLVRELARGLESVHQAGVLHRDLKPENVLFDERGTPKLVDFGLARLAESASLTRTGAIMGSPRYMPPEQASGASTADARSDVYGLGAVLYHCLTGRPPFEGKSAMVILVDVVKVAPPAPRTLRPQVPAALEAICMRCLEKDPAARYSSAQALAEDLTRFLQGEAVGGRRVPPWVLAALLGVGALLLVAGLNRTFGPSRPTIPRAEPGEPQPVADAPQEVPPARGGADAGILTKVFAARERGDDAEAEALLSEAMLDPRIASPIEIVWQRARVRHERSKRGRGQSAQGALNDLELVLELHPGEGVPVPLFEVHLRRGQLLEDRHEIYGAREAFASARALRPADPEAFVGWARTSILLGGGAEVGEQLEALQAGASAGDPAFERAGERLREQKQQLEERKRAHLAVKVRHLQGKASGDKVLQAISAEPGFYDGYVTLGRALLQATRWEEAERAFSRAIQLRADPNSRRGQGGQAFLGRSSAWAGMNREAEAKLDLLASHRYDGGGTRSLPVPDAITGSLDREAVGVLGARVRETYGREHLQFLQKLVEDAILVLGVTELEASQPLQLARGRIMAACGDLGGALETLSLVRGAAAEEAQVEVAMVYLRSGRYARALKAANLAGVSGRSSLRQRERVALVTAEARRLVAGVGAIEERVADLQRRAVSEGVLSDEPALRALSSERRLAARRLLTELRAFMQDDPRRPSAYRLRGRLRMALGEGGLADRDLRLANRLGHDDPESSYWRAVFEAGEGHRKEALRHLASALKSCVVSGDDALRDKIGSLRRQVERMPGN